MDEDGLAAVYRKCLTHARKVLPPDPALEAQDLVQAAWVKVGGRLDRTRSEGEQVAFLCRAIGQVAIDARRRLRWRAVGGVVDERLPAPRDPEAEALARLALAPLLAAAAAGDRATLALLLLALGYSWRETEARLGVSSTTLWRDRRAGRAA